MPVKTLPQYSNQNIPRVPNWFRNNK